MPKRVGIITLYGLENYGNRLQNFAVYRILKNIGVHAKTYVYHGSLNEVSKINIYKWQVNRKTNYKFASNLNASKIKAHKISFYNFTRQYIPTEAFYSLNDLSKRADYFVLGSDQVWNPTWYKDIDKDLYLLTFARSEQKICLAPSFGIDELPNEWKDFFKKNLQTFASLSVREQSGAKIIKELTGISVPVLLDPTLMIDVAVWKKISKRPYSVETKEPYVLTYFLGNTPDNAKKTIENLLSAQSLTVKQLMREDYPDLYACGPREFIYLIANANLILTDSFHACAFSFLFSKPFVVYEREDSNINMSSRIQNFLKEFHLERKSHGEVTTNDIFECDYSDGKNKLMQLRAQEMDYLKKSILGGN